MYPLFDQIIGAIKLQHPDNFQTAQCKFREFYEFGSVLRKLLFLNSRN